MKIEQEFGLVEYIIDTERVEAKIEHKPGLYIYIVNWTS